MTISRQWFLVSRPTGPAGRENVELREVELAELADGEVRVRNEILSVDPYMRGRMDEGHSYVPPFGLDEPLTGQAIGTVVASRAPGLPEGARVQHMEGWRDVAQGPASRFAPLPDRADVPPSWWLGVLGGTGQTAWVALHEAAKLREGDVVFVSGAAGAVGSVAGQLARRAGAALVIGSAGSEEKAARAVERFGYDTVLNYRSGPVLELLGQAAPEGIDVYLDNVGGDHLEAALFHARDGGRFAQVGSISGYDGADAGPGVRYTWNIVRRGLNLHGFTGGRYSHLRPAFLDDVLEAVVRGEIVGDETWAEGLESAYDAFLGLFRGQNTGKMLVRL